MFILYRKYKKTKENKQFDLEIFYNSHIETDAAFNNPFERSSLSIDINSTNVERHNSVLLGSNDSAYNDWSFIPATNTQTNNVAFEMSNPRYEDGTDSKLPARRLP